MRTTILALAIGSVAAGQWPPAKSPAVQMTADGTGVWKLVSSTAAEQAIESEKRFAARPGDTFEIAVRLRVDTATKALPELASYDANGNEIAGRSLLATGPTQVTTDWQSVRRVFAAVPGAASVRARIRFSGRGEVLVGHMEFAPKTTDPYETGALYYPIYPNRRRGLVLSPTAGIVNTSEVSQADRDGDGKWALITIDLDKASQPDMKGEDWRTSFNYRPNELYWFDGAVLKSDSVRENREPDFKRALHYRARVHRGPYRAIMSDPGRAVAVSTDGKTWRRFEGGAEAELGRLEADAGYIDLWVDACYRDATSVGPVYFDYVRLFPVDHAPSADELFRAARQSPARLNRGSADHRKVAVTVSGPKFASGKHWPVRSGVPIPRGELASSRHVMVTDTQGNRIPSSSRVMASWPDGSVKWLFTDFHHDFSRSPTGTYEVHYGNNVMPGSSEAPAVQIRETSAGLEVDTGAIRFVVSNTRFGIVENVRLSSGKVLQTEPIAAEIREPGGKIWRASELPVDKIEVEQAGPLHSVIRIETKLAESGKPAAGFNHRARIHAYAGSPLLHVDYFVANTDSRPANDVGGSMASKLFAESIALKLRPAAPVVEAVHGLSGRSGTGSVVQQNAGTALLNGVATQKQLPGWLAVALRGGGAVHVGLKDFREQFPKALRWDANEIELALWAREGGSYEWYEGVGKTHHLSLLYSDATSGDAALLAEGPVSAVATPEWYTASGAFGPMVTAAQSGLPAVEKALADNMKGPVVDEVGLGFENYGDHTSPGYVKGSRLWDNNEYDTPAAGMVHFARTGDMASLKIALAGALHYLDVDTIHYSSRHANWARAAHSHSHVVFGHHTAEPPNMHHAGYVQGLIWYSYFTGEPIGIAGAMGIADWVLKSVSPEDCVGSMERALGHSLMTLTDTYEATWDDKYLRGAARLADWATKWEHPVLSGFMAPITEAPAFYAGSPGVGAGTLHSGLIKFNGWSKSPEIDKILDRAARWTLTFPWRPPANIIAKAPIAGVPGTAIAMCENLRLMHYAAARSDDPLFLAVPRKSVIQAFVTEPAVVRTRSTGRVYNYLPWYLTTLSSNGNPQPDDELRIEPSAPHLKVPRGRAATVSFRVRNTGRIAVEIARLSLQLRLDFTARALAAETGGRLEPGETREFRYEITAPEHINLTSEANRISHGHFTGLYRRMGRQQISHLPVKIEITNSTAPKEARRDPVHGGHGSYLARPGN